MKAQIRNLSKTNTGIEFDIVYMRDGGAVILTETRTLNSPAQNKNDIVNYVKSKLEDLENLLSIYQDLQTIKDQDITK